MLFAAIQNQHERSLAQNMKPMTILLKLNIKISILVVRELLPRPEGRGFPAASSFLCRHSPLASGHVLQEFSVSVSLAQTYIRFAMQRFRSHRTDSGCSLPTVARISPRNAPYQGADLPGSTLSLQGIISQLERGIPRNI